MIYCITTRMLSVTPKVRTKLIKFRYGPSRNQQSSHDQQSTPGQQSSASNVAQPGEAIWDFQIPTRWKRRPLDEEEIAVINNGGPL